MCSWRLRPKKNVSGDWIKTDGQQRLSNAITGIYRQEWAILLMTTISLYGRRTKLTEYTHTSNKSTPYKWGEPLKDHIFNHLHTLAISSLLFTWNAFFFNLELSQAQVKMCCITFKCGPEKEYAQRTGLVNRHLNVSSTESKLCAPSMPICHVLIHVLALGGKPRSRA